MGAGELQPLTADTVARAVIAAARAYGDDPIAAMTASSPKGRRALVAAAGGLAIATGQPHGACSRVLGIGHSSIVNARKRGLSAYQDAELAAVRALGVGDAAPQPAHAPAAPAAASIAESEAPKSADAVVLQIDGPPAVKLARPRTITALAARREVLKVLALEPCTAPDLMEVLNLSESQVRNALRDLCEEREVTHTPLTAEGWRAQTWRLADAVRGAA